MSKLSPIYLDEDESVESYSPPSDFDEDSDSDYVDDEDQIEQMTRKEDQKMLLDDNNTKNFNERISLLDDNDDDNLVETRNVKSRDYGESTEPWRVNAQIWDRLHKFQKDGVVWLQKQTDHRCGGILADEMGLGKTIQTAVFLRSIQETGRIHYKYKGLDTCLIVCHVSILRQWIECLHEWFPKLRVFLLHSMSTTRNNSWEDSVLRKLHKREEHFPNGAVVLTTYTIFTKLHKSLVNHPWQLVVLDEGHFIRNEDTKCAQAMKKLTTTQRFILTGTPFQNRLSEFWKLVDFVYPGRLSDASTFHRNFVRVIDAGSNVHCTVEAAAKAYECLVALHRAVKPLILRRLQEDYKDVLNLPNKNEIIMSCELTERQRRLYQQYCDSDEVELIKEGKVKAFRGINKLGNICNHPGLYRNLPPSHPDFGDLKRSGKVAMVFKLFKEWFKDPKNRVVFFTQRVNVIQMMEHFLNKKGIRFVSMTGSDTATSRPETIQEFQNDEEIKVFLMTTRTGGLGLNLACANKAIIFDPDWNPQADNQAKNRIYRMGQKNDVSIIRLVSNGTIEDRKFFKQVKKETIAAQLLHNSDVQHVIPNNTLHDLFRLKPAGLEGSEIGVYMEGEIAGDDGLKSKNKDERKSAKKVIKNKLAGFEDRKLLLSLFDDDKLVAMRQHSITVQNSSKLNGVQKREMRSAVEKAVGSLIHTQGRLARLWKNGFHKFLQEKYNLPVTSDYHVEKEKKDKYWGDVHSHIRSNSDDLELKRLTELAIRVHDLLNGMPSVSEDMIHRILVHKHDKSNPTQMYFIREIISTLATYDEKTATWSIRSQYETAIPESPMKRKSEGRSTSEVSKSRRSLSPRDESSNSEEKKTRRSVTPKVDGSTSGEKKKERSVTPGGESSARDEKKTRRSETPRAEASTSDVTRKRRSMTPKVDVPRCDTKNSRRSTSPKGEASTSDAKKSRRSSSPKGEDLTSRRSTEKSEIPDGPSTSAITSSYFDDDDVIMID